MGGEGHEPLYNMPRGELILIVLGRKIRYTSRKRRIASSLTQRMVKKLSGKEQNIQTLAKIRRHAMNA